MVAVVAGIKELRDNLRAYLERVQDGEEVLITDRGRPIARITPHPGRSRREELIARGTLTPAKQPWDPRVLDDLFHVDVPLHDLIRRDRDGVD